MGVVHAAAVGLLVVIEKCILRPLKSVFFLTYAASCSKATPNLRQSKKVSAAKNFTVTKHSQVVRHARVNFDLKAVNLNDMISGEKRVK